MTPHQDTLPDAFFEPTEDPLVFRPTGLSRGPWDNRALHGGPPCALLATALARHQDDSTEREATAPAQDGLPAVVSPRRDTTLARITFSLLRRVPMAPLRVSVVPSRLGRRVHRLTAVLSTADGVPVVEARAIRIRRHTTTPTPPVPPLAPWPDPVECPRLEFDFFRHPIGYHRGVELRVVHGTWGGGPIGVWARLRAPLVRGRPLTAIETVVTLADAQSGMGVPLNPEQWTFVNPDLNVVLARRPAPGWVGFDIRSWAGPDSSGLAESSLRDAQGPLGRAAQTLMVAPRD